MAHEGKLIGREGYPGGVPGWSKPTLYGWPIILEYPVSDPQEKFLRSPELPKMEAGGSALSQLPPSGKSICNAPRNWNMIHQNLTKCFLVYSWMQRTYASGTTNTFSDTRLPRHKNCSKHLIGTRERQIHAEQCMRKGFNFNINAAYTRSTPTFIRLFLIWFIRMVLFI